MPRQVDSANTQVRFLGAYLMNKERLHEKALEADFPGRFPGIVDAKNFFCLDAREPSRLSFRQQPPHFPAIGVPLASQHVFGFGFWKFGVVDPFRPFRRLWRILAIVFQVLAVSRFYEGVPARFFLAPAFVRFLEHGLHEGAALAVLFSLALDGLPVHLLNQIVYVLGHGRPSFAGEYTRRRFRRTQRRFRPRQERRLYLSVSRTLSGSFFQPYLSSNSLGVSDPPDPWPFAPHRR